MRKITIIGCYAQGISDHGGQPVKTRIIVDELRQKIGISKIKLIDTYMWRKRPIRFLLSVISSFVKSKKTIIMPASNGIKIFTVIFYYLSKVFRDKDLYYIVIGGWLPELLNSNKSLQKKMNVYNNIMVETKSMKNDLERAGIINVVELVNIVSAKHVESVAHKKEVSNPVKLVFFSRIVEKKGIFEAIDAIKEINQKQKTTRFVLDIYGKVYEEASDRFNQEMSNSHDDINYKGFVDPDGAISLLSKYDFQIFPTKFKTEGIPGSIIYSFFAGTPIICSRWDSCFDIVDENRTGFTYTFNSYQKLVSTLNELLEKDYDYSRMSKNCILESTKYESTNVIDKLIELIEIDVVQ